MANNKTLTTNLATSPWYDDYDPKKNYVRILFKPSLAVQARELTQLQSALQQQISYGSEHIFDEGALVKNGKLNIDFNVKYVMVEDNDTANNSLNVSELMGKSLVSANSGVTALVSDYANGAVSSYPDTKMIFVKYQSASTINYQQKTFMADDTIVANNGVTFKVTNYETSIGNATAATITDGVMYAKGHFIYFPAQTLIIDKFKNNPTCRVGLDLIESVVDSDEDPTLLDPASGTTNYAAPGADRLKITPQLVAYSDPADITEDFVELANIVDGVIQSIATKTEYATIADEFARRTYDESGNYFIKGLNVQLREHNNDGTNYGYLTPEYGGNSSLLAVGVEPGKAYVYGYEVKKLTTQYIPVEKGIDYKSVESQAISANYGNYVLVNELVGAPNLNIGVNVKLYDTVQERISTLKYSTPSPDGNVIGTAILKSVELGSGTPGIADTKYRAYLTNIKMSDGSFDEVKSIYFENSSTADLFMDVVGTATLQEKAFNSHVYMIPTSNTRKIRDDSDEIETSFTFKKTFDVSIATPGTFTINTGSTDEIFPYGAGTLNSSQKNTNFIMTLNTAATVSMTGTISGTSNTSIITGSSTTFTTALNVGDKITASGQTKTIASIVDNTSLTIDGTLDSDLTSASFVKSYLVGDIIDLNSLGATGSARSITINSSTSAAFDLKETLSNTVSATISTNLSKTNAREIKKTVKRNRLVQINCATNTANTVGPWNLGFSDVIQINSIRLKSGSDFTSTSEGTLVTNKFRLDNGQRDDIYEHAKLVKVTGTTVGATDRLLINLDYFTHDTSQGVGYLSIDSYPIDDVNGSSNTSAITTAEIPYFTSPTTGRVYDLRDSIDTRNVKTNTATDTTVIGSVSTNPTASTTLVYPVSGLHTPTPNESFMIDYSYYLPRKDLIVIDSGGQVKSVRGIPSLTPAIPSVPSDAMAFAELEIAPYPSLPASIATLRKRPQYTNKVRNIAIRRYTMEQIGFLEKRIENLEYYTALNFLEKATMDLKILDDSGLDRFKNGILVDPFDDHSIGDTSNPDYRIAVDRIKSELRPTFELGDIGNVYNTSDGVTKSGNLLTLPYTEKVFISQPQAVTTRNAAGLFYSYQGTITLTPDSDYWADTTQVPDLQINNDNDLSNWQNMADVWGTDWGDWSTNWTSTSVTSSTGQTSATTKSGRATTTTNTITTTSVATTTTDQTRSGLELNVGSSTTTQNYGDRIIDTSVVPYIRSKVISFEGQGFKPNTWLYATFDNELVSQYITPDGDVMGGPLITDENGSVSGTFTIPNNDTMKFRTGTKLFRLNDNVFGYTAPGLATTSGEVSYTASGLNQTRQGTIVSTVNAVVSPVIVVDSRTQVSSETSTSVAVTSTTSYSPPPPSPPSTPRPPAPTPVVTPKPPVSTPTYNPPVTPPPPVVQEPPTPQPPVLPQPPPPPTRPVPFIGPAHGGGSEHGDGTGGRGNGDPIAQTFSVKVPDGVPGVFLTSIDVYFASKHPIYGVEIELRELNSGGYLTQNVIPYSKTIVPSANMVVSDDATLATSASFIAPVYLLANTDYAFVIRPIADNDLTHVWVSKLGGKDVSTGNIITKQPYSGVLFASANDNTWEPIQDEDIKFNLWRASFTPGYGTAFFNNEPTDFLKLSSTSDHFNTMGEEIHGKTRVSVSGVTGGTISVGDLFEGVTSGAIGTVSSFVSPDVQLENVSIGTSFITGENCNVLNSDGSSKGVTCTLGTVIVPIGNVVKYYNPDDDNIFLDLNRTNEVAFLNSDIIRSQTSNTYATIETFLDKKLNLINVQSSEINLSGTTVEWIYKTTANNSTLDSDFHFIQNNSDHYLPAEKILMAKTNEINKLSGEKSLQLRARMYTSNEYISPVVDTSRTHTIYVHNIVNNDATGEDSRIGGNALARYMTQKVTLAEGQDAEDIKVYVTGYRPIGSDIKLYMKALNGNDSDIFENLDWSPLTLTSKDLYSSSENTEDFKEFEYSLPVESLTGDNGEYQYTNSAGILYTSYKYFAIKIVLLSDNSVLVPRCRDLRAICLQR